MGKFSTVYHGSDPPLMGTLIQARNTLDELVLAIQDPRVAREGRQCADQLSELINAMHRNLQSEAELEVQSNG